MDMPLPEILHKVLAYQCPLVEVTGGEPLLQAETAPLVLELIERGCTVLLETNGSLDIDLVDRRCVRIVDIKCPSSGESQRNDYENIRRLTSRDEVKYVIADRLDYQFARRITADISAVHPPPSGITIHFSPAFGLMDPAQLVEWILADRLEVRLNLQLHKLIWHPDRRGV
jgi:7-carboxy-7-deazaguanine synthase